MLFLPAKVLFVADWITLERMPWRKLWSYDVDGMIESIRDAEAMDVNLIAPAHGPTGGKEKAAEIRRYLEALRAAVIEKILEGKELEEMQKEIRLDGFRHLDHYEEWLPDNIEGMAWGPSLADGRRLLVLISDDNFNPTQRPTQVIFIAVK